MDDIKLAVLGNGEAAKRLTDAGVLVPCPGCRNNSSVGIRYVCGDHFGLCGTCGWTGPFRNTEYDARLAWNTRAPILSAEELKKVEEIT